MDCGPTCLRMISKYYGKSYSLQNLRNRTFITKTGVNLLGLSQAAESIGFRTSGVKITFDVLKNDVALPCIVHWNANHFVVCYDIHTSRKYGTTVRIADPAMGLLTLPEAEFRKSWENSVRDGEGVGMALLLQPGPEFGQSDDEPEKGTRNLSFFIKYLTPYRKQMVQLLIGMITVSILQLIFPFLTQSLVDVGVRDGNIGFIQLVLLAQAVLFITRLTVEYIRSWILLHMNTRINIALISDFLIKLMKMPLRFFDSKNVGDILQRIGRSQPYRVVFDRQFHFHLVFLHQLLCLCLGLGLLQPDHPLDFPARQHHLCCLGAVLHEIPQNPRFQTVRTICQGTKQCDPDDQRHARHQTQQLRTPKTLELGTHSGQIVQNQHQELGHRAISAGRFGFFLTKPPTCSSRFWQPKAWCKEPSPSA